MNTLHCLLPLLCLGAPGAAPRAQSIATMLTIHDTGAPLGVLAAQSSDLGTPARRRIVPLHIVTPRMKGARPTSAEGAGAAPEHVLAARPANPPLPFVKTSETLNIEGIAVTDNAPSDANGAVGDSQYVQWVNTRLAIYRKSDGALLLGPVAGNAVFGGFGGSPGADACRTSNVGDPIVQYDKLARRWILTQLAWAPADTATGPYYQCIAVSTSADATAGYYRYVLDMRDAAGAIVFNDYPKMAVWPDAYYFTFVLFDTAEGGYRGPRACGIERAAMLAGAHALVRCRDLGTAFGPLLAADLDGTTAPPTGSPNFLLSLDFTGDGGGDHLFLWRFSFSADTLSGAITLPVAPFTIACPGSFGGPCVQQPAPGEPLDAMGDRLMYRLAYRNFGAHESLVVNHSVQQSGAAADGPLAVRWYEIRQPNRVPVVYQQGEVAPDTDSRWMGSIAMDKNGNIALGYSVSGAATPPGVRYTGRLRSEPPGRMEGEATIVNGSGAQIDTFGRWGDYSAMAVDPVGDCDFWYTQQYIATTGSFTWRSRIANTHFRNCR